MHLYHAKIIAENLARQIMPYCEPGRCLIAGSIRREKPVVKDIEIVCIPYVSTLTANDIFGEPYYSRTVIHPDYEKTVRSWGTIQKGKFGGRMMQVTTSMDIEGKTHEINIDLFTPAPADFYRQLAIRTGSAEYAHKHIANAWIRKGWCGVEGIGLCLIKQCYRESEKHPWRLRSGITDPERPPVWQSEEEFFRWLGIQYLEPTERNL